MILVMSGIEEWWSGLSEGQKTVTGSAHSYDLVPRLKTGLIL